MQGTILGSRATGVNEDPSPRALMFHGKDTSGALRKRKLGLGWGRGVVIIISVKGGLLGPAKT